jgi:type IV secretion system protein VirB6
VATGFCALPTAPSGTSAQLLQQADQVVCAAIGSASTAVSSYVVPALWAAFLLTVLIWSFMILQGKLTSNIEDWVGRGLVIMLIITAAGQYYQPWLAKPLLSTPTQLSAKIMAAVSGASSSDPLTAIEKKTKAITLAAFEGAGRSGLTHIGDMFVFLVEGLLFMVAGAILTIVALVNFIYAKLGLALVLIVGPFFVGSLIFQPIRGWFFSWLNTALYFVMLYVLTTAYVAICITLAETMINNIINNAGMQVINIAGAPASVAPRLVIAAGSAYALLADSISFLVIAFILAFLGYELRTIASSMTGGSGGSAFAGMRAAAHSASNAMRNSSQKSSQNMQRQNLAMLSQMQDSQKAAAAQSQATRESAFNQNI